MNESTHYYQEPSSSFSDAGFVDKYSRLKPLGLGQFAVTHQITDGITIANVDAISGPRGTDIVAGFTLGNTPGTEPAARNDSAISLACALNRLRLLPRLQLQDRA
jgi:hypothetical protein